MVIFHHGFSTLPCHGSPAAARPENLLINELGRIVIIDMGHAKRVASSGAPAPLALSRTTTTNPYGTPAFNAPEAAAFGRLICMFRRFWKGALESWTKLVCDGICVGVWNFVGLVSIKHNVTDVFRLAGNSMCFLVLPRVLVSIHKAYGEQSQSNMTYIYNKLWRNLVNGQW